jgi:hypothetical protein
MEGLCDLVEALVARGLTLAESLLHIAHQQPALRKPVSKAGGGSTSEQLPVNEIRSGGLRR